jgi:glycerol uptake facilitator-like aquaporin
VLLAHAMFEQPLWQPGLRVRDGGAQWLAEGVATCGLVLTNLGTMRIDSHRVPEAVGLYIVAAYWFTASTSFANPAVTLARSLTQSFSGIRPEDVIGFVSAQLAGALVAIVLARALGLWRREEA